MGTIKYMLTMRNKENKDLKSLYSSSLGKTYMVSLLNSSEFKAVLRRYGRVYTRVLFPTSKVPSRLQLLTKFGDMLLRLTKHHGPVFVVKYLKALTVALQRYVGGSPLSSLREIEPTLPLPRLASCGLPSFIPSRERVELRKLTPSVVRWWLTMFSVYRIISVPGKLKLETITAPFGGDRDSLVKVSTWLFRNSKRLVSYFTNDFTPKASLGLERIQKASPSASVSWKGFLADAWNWKDRCEFFQFANFGQGSLLYDMTMLHSLQKISPLLQMVPLSACKLGHSPETSKPLGSLALKEEAAGKIRVFAMVDIWTQSVLKPLHNWLFDLFHLFPNDSTHNQDTGFLRAKAKAVYYGQSWCYDLSAATDRLPIMLQSAILDSLFGHIECSGWDSGITYGQAWANLLVKRDYILPKQTLGKEEIPFQRIRYSVGQPMGAYSSWAMLNLCHHLLLQYICFQIYKVDKWYTCYEVLGDDIVIFDRQVADHYIQLMEGELDVQCNRSKSLISPERPVIEFAKRTSIGEAEVSAFSWRQIRSFDSLLGRACTAADLISRRGVTHPLRAFKAVVGPQWGPVPSYEYSLISFAGILVNRGLVPFKTLSEFLVDPKNPLRYIGGRIIANVRTGVLEDFIIRYWKGETLQMPKLKTVELGRLFQLNQAAARGYIEDRLIDLYKELEVLSKTYLDRCQASFDPDNGVLIPKDVLAHLFYTGGRFTNPHPRFNMSTLSFEDLVAFKSDLEQLRREFLFFEQPVERREILDDSFKLLRFIIKSRKAGGSLSFETTKLI